MADTPSKTDHAAAAATAAGHLTAAVQALRDAYDHPHHGDRLDNIESHLVNVASLIARMPEEEESRADYAARLMAAYRSRDLPNVLPEHAERLLTQELERTA